MKPTQELHDAGQSLWLDNITRDLLTSGKLKGYIEQLAVTGLTSNPTIFDQAIERSSAYDPAIAKGAAEGASAEEIFFQLAIDDLRAAADLFGPVHEGSDGVDGWVSLEVSPLLADDAAATVAAAITLHQRADRANLFIKIPGTPAGLQAIGECIFAGVPVNVTLLFSAAQYVAAAGAYMTGLERRLAEGLSPDVASVASLFVSRWDKALATQGPEALRDRVGIAAGAQAYRSYHELLASDRWQRLANAGARPQRLLFASTSTKNPAAPDTLYISGLAAPMTINTMPEDTLLAFADHGHVAGTLDPAGGDADLVMSQLAAAGMDPAELALRLQREGAAAFEASWNNLVACIGDRAGQLVAGR